MLVVRPLAIVQDGVLRRQLPAIRLKPRIDVLGPDLNDAAVMAGRRDSGGGSSVMAAKDIRSGSPCPLPRDNRHATSMSCSG